MFIYKHDAYEHDKAHIKRNIHAVAKWCDPCIFVCKIVKFKYFYPIFSQFWSISITCPKNVFIWMENRLDHILWFDFEKEVFSRFGSFECKFWPISAKKFYENLIKMM